MTRHAITAAAFLVTLVALAWAIKGHHDRTSSIKAIGLFGGAEGAAIIRHPYKVLAYRLGDPSENPEGPFDIQAYPIVAGPIEVPPPTARALSVILLSDASYYWGGSKSCVPEYGVRITFIRGSHEVDVNLCFGCAQGIVRRDGKPSTSFEFDPSTHKLAARIRPLFPDDAEIQALP